MILQKRRGNDDDSGNPDKKIISSNNHDNKVKILTLQRIMIYFETESTPFITPYSDILDFDNYRLEIQNRAQLNLL